MTIFITPALLERAGHAKRRYPCGANIRHGKNRADVAFRPWHDHYNIFARSGEWLASFSDASLTAETEIENVTCASGVTLSTRGFDKKITL